MNLYIHLNNQSTILSVVIAISFYSQSIIGMQKPAKTHSTLYKQITSQYQTLQNIKQRNLGEYYLESMNQFTNEIQYIICQQQQYAQINNFCTKRAEYRRYGIIDNQHHPFGKIYINGALYSIYNNLSAENISSVPHLGTIIQKQKLTPHVVLHNSQDNMIPSYLPNEYYLVLLTPEGRSLAFSLGGLDISTIDIIKPTIFNIEETYIKEQKLSNSDATIKEVQNIRGNYLFTIFGRLINLEIANFISSEITSHKSSPFFLDFLNNRYEIYNLFKEADIKAQSRTLLSIENASDICQLAIFKKQLHDIELINTLYNKIITELQEDICTFCFNHITQKNNCLAYTKYVEKSLFRYGKIHNNFTTMLQNLGITNTLPGIKNINTISTFIANKSAIEQKIEQQKQAHIKKTTKRKKTTQQKVIIQNSTPLNRPAKQNTAIELTNTPELLQNTSLPIEEKKDPSRKHNLDHNNTHNDIMNLINQPMLYHPRVITAHKNTNETDMYHTLPLQSVPIIMHYGKKSIWHNSTTGNHDDLFTLYGEFYNEKTGDRQSVVFQACRGSANQIIYHIGMKKNQLKDFTQEYNADFPPLAINQKNDLPEFINAEGSNDVLIDGSNKSIIKIYDKNRGIVFYLYTGIV